MGTIIVGIILLALFVVPFVVLQINKKKKQNKKDNETA